MVRVSVRGSTVHCIYESPHGGRTTGMCTQVCVCVVVFAVLPQDRTKLQRHPDYLSLMQISALEMKRVNVEMEIVIVSRCCWSLSECGLSCGFLMHLSRHLLCTNIYTVNIMDGAVLPAAWAICIPAPEMTTAESLQSSIHHHSNWATGTN